jgi:hypothetical protein
MKNLKNYTQFVNEKVTIELKISINDGIVDVSTNEPKENKKDKEDGEEPNFNMPHKGDEKINFKDFDNIDAGGIENIEYKDDDKIISKSPLSKKAKNANDRGNKITYKESQDFEKKLISTTKDGVKIYLVDADHVRDDIDIDMTMGGHSYVYPNYIPEDEIWIDEEMNKEDRYSTIVHEITERNEMRNRHLEYNKAHDDASAAEIKVRKKLEKERKEEE